MADRVNTKFVVILIVVLVALTGVGLAGVWMLRPSTADRIERAERYLQQGQAEKAIEQYAIALKKERTNADLMSRYVNAANQVVTDDVQAAENYLKFQMFCISELVTQDPSNTVHFEQLMNFYIDVANDLSDLSVWDVMLDRCERTLISHPDHALASRYRGIAQVNRMGRYNLTPDQVNQAAQDLQQAIEKEPQDHQALYYLAMWNVWQSKLLDRPEVDPKLPQRHRQEAQKIAQLALDTAPQNPQRQIDMLMVLLNIAKSTDAQTAQLVDELERQVLADPHDASVVAKSAELVLRVANAGRKIQRDDNPLEIATVGIDRACDLLRAGLEANPENRTLMVTLGQLLQRQGQPDEAAVMYEKAYDLKVKESVFETFKSKNLRFMAGLQRVDLLLAKADQAEGQQREAIMAQAQSLVEEAGAGYQENGAVELRLGRLAYMRGDWQDASQKLESASRSFNDRNPVALLLSSQVW